MTFAAIIAVVIALPLLTRRVRRGYLAFCRYMDEQGDEQ